MFSEHSADLGRVQLSYAAGPQHGPPLIFLHGVCRRWQDFLPLAPAIGLRWRFIGLDHRGHGRSGRADSYRVTDYVDDAVDFLNRVVDEPAVVYGHSLGAMVAAGMAARVPDKVRGLILEDPPFSTMGPRIVESPIVEMYTAWQRVCEQGQSFLTRQLTIDKLTGQLADVIVGGRRLGDLRDAVSLRFTASCLIELDARVFDPILAGEWLSGYDVDQVAAAIRCPTLLFQGDPAFGAMLTSGDRDRFAAGTKGCIPIYFPGHGHLLHWTATDTVVRHLIGFLESL